MMLDRQQIPAIVDQVNHYLRGERHSQLAAAFPATSNFGREWLTPLSSNGRPPRTDGKSLGTCIEKLLKAEISRHLNIPLTGSSATGVDIPELLLNTKATSDRQPQSSEPFDSPYERVLGAKYDIIACVYNGNEFFESTDVPLQINAAMYYDKSQVADAELCRTAKLLQSLAVRQRINLSLGLRALRAIVYAKKAGRGSGPYRLLKSALPEDDESRIRVAIEAYELEMETVGQIKEPSENEWARFLSSPLDGKISISFALQWRYQYKPNAEGVRCYTRCRE